MNILFAESHPTAGRFAPWLLGCILSIGLAACGGGGDAPPAAATLAPAITTQPVGTTVAAGQVARFGVTATGSDPLTYQWKKGGAAINGATSTSYTTPATVPADSGALFTVTVSNAVGSVTSDPATLTVGPVQVAPSITTQPAATSVVAGQTASFNVVATGTAPLTYQWRKNGARINGATAASFTTAPTLAADNGALFAVTVTNAVTSVTSDDAALTVTAAATPPTFTTQPSNATVNAGQTATFTVVVAGTAPFTYQWSRNGTAIAGATAASYTTPVTVDADTGASFRVVVSNVVTSATSDTATLTVTPKPVMPVITAQPQGLGVDAGQAVSFNVTATGTAPLSYQWKRDGTDIAGATAANYTLATTTLADNNAQFTVIVSNLAGSVLSDVAILSVAQVNPVKITTQPADASVVVGQTASFSVVASGTGPLTYQWRKNGTNIAGATAASYTTPATVAADNNALFSVVVSNTAGPVTSANATLTVGVLLAPSITSQPANTNVILHTTATFTVTASGTAPLAYQWQKNSVDIVGATGASYTTPATTFQDDQAAFTVAVSNPSPTVATSTPAVLTVTLLLSAVTRRVADDTL